MNKLLKLSILEFRKMFKTTGIYIGIMIAIAFSVAIGIQARLAPEAFNSKHVFSFFSSIANLVLIVFAAKSLGDEFQLKTSTQLFTSKQPRALILLSRVLSIVFLGLVMAAISSGILITFKLLLNEPMTFSIALKDIWIQTYTFVVYAFVISTFAVLVTTVTLNTTTTMVTTLGAFWIAPNIISMIINKYPQYEKFLNLIPFLIKNNFV